MKITDRVATAATAPAATAHIHDVSASLRQSSHSSGKRVAKAAAAAAIPSAGATTAMAATTRATTTCNSKQQREQQQDAMAPVVALKGIVFTVGNRISSNIRKSNTGNTN
jgi:hypothetical protein